MSDWVWLGGWSSGFDCWKDDIKIMYPGIKHEFADAHDLIAGHTSLEGILGQVPGVLIAWSLGSLILHRWLALAGDVYYCRGWRFVCVAPVFDFCRRPGPWPARVIKRMIESVKKDKSKLLESFWSKMVEGQPHVEGHWQVSWQAKARQYHEDALVHGLEYLMNTVVEPDTLNKYSDQITCISGINDAVTPWSQNLIPSNFQTFKHHFGHLPFIQTPELFKDWVGL
jgi:hypothetical protein